MVQNTPTQISCVDGMEILLYYNPVSRDDPELIKQKPEFV